jgi:hypothetical protein
MRKLLVPVTITLLSLSCGGATACVLGATYNLPIPFGMYASGAAAALVASFAIVAYVLKIEPARSTLSGPLFQSDKPAQVHLSKQLVNAVAWASVGCLLLTVVTALRGTQNILTNPGMTLFWIVFSLGMTYATVLVGDIYALVNPWRKLCDWVEHFDSGAFRGQMRYPGWLAYYPALALYMVFIWIELFGEIQPRTLSALLLGYTALNLIAAWLFGKENWFRYGEFFSVFFRLIGMMAPLEYVPAVSADGSYLMRLRKPFIGLLDAHADHISLLLFVVFMLSSTAFDGVHLTRPWVTLFWKDIYPLLAAVFDRPYFFFLDLYYAWQWTMLILLPFVYLAVYLALLWLAKQVSHSSMPLRALALRFAFTLIPIAFVYNMTHYYGELISQGVQIVRMVSDPFNLGWNLFGTAGLFLNPITLDAGTVWHTQVALILFGHIVSVYLAHVEALKVFPNRRHAALSQAPMLVLMVLLTTVGLWILSLPIDAGQMVTPAA